MHGFCSQQRLWFFSKYVLLLIAAAWATALGPACLPFGPYPAQYGLGSPVSFLNSSSLKEAFGVLKDL
jgi:hypothetical protein